MTKMDYYWASNKDWYERKDGVRVIKDTAPKEAKESYERYLKQMKRYQEYLAKGIYL